MEIDKAELKKIADDARARVKDEEKNRKKDERREKKNKQEAARQKAGRIINSIPDNIKKAAGHGGIQTEKGLLIVARIPIVNEKMTSIMASRGYLSEHEESVLRMVRRRLESVKIDGVELGIKRETRSHTFTSGDGLDDATGPCKHYYIEAKTIIS